MTRGVSVIVAATCILACSRSAEPPSTLLSERFLALARASGAIDAARRELDQIAYLVRQRIVETNAHPTEALNHVVFVQLGFEREVDDEDVRFMLLPSVIAGRRGSCVGLAQLYLSLGERLQLPLSGVLVPGHIYIRYEDAQSTANIELLRRGEAMPRDWYVKKYAVPAGINAYLRPLTDDEAVAVVHYNLGNALRNKRTIRAAMEYYTAAVRLFDGFPEAHASRGLAYQLWGDLGAAAASYERARTLHPELPGLKRNIAALSAERRPAR